MTPALRWAAMRAILFFSMKKWTKSQDSVHKPQPFRRERRAEAVSNRGPSAYQPNALPLGQTGSPLSVHLSTIIYRLRCDVWRTIFVPKLCLCGRRSRPTTLFLSVLHWRVTLNLLLIIFDCLICRRVSPVCRFRELLPVMDPTLNNPSRGELEATVENNLSVKGQFTSPCKTRK